MEVKTYSIYSYQRNTISQLRAIFDDAANWDDVSGTTNSVTYTYGNATLKFSYSTGSLSMTHEISTGSATNISSGNRYTGIIVCKTASSLAVILQTAESEGELPSSAFSTINQLRFVLTKHHNIITGTEEKGLVNVKHSDNNMKYNVSSAGDPNEIYEFYSLSSDAVKTVLYNATTKNSQCYCPHVFIPKYSNVGEANAVVDVCSKKYYMMAGGLYVLDD